MHYNEKRAFIGDLMQTLSGFLSIAFWILVIYGFDDGVTAGVTVIAALIHESGHVAYGMMKGIKAPVKGKLNGFRLSARGSISYNEELVRYAAGPLANLAAAAASLPFICEATGYAVTFCTVNLLTAVSNLLPVRGFDGYGILRCIARWRESERIMRRTDLASRMIIVISCIGALYTMDRIGEGYWMFFVFFCNLYGEISRSVAQRGSF